MASPKQAISDLKSDSSQRRLPDQLKTLFKWLAPGLSVKRWLLMSALGVLLIGLGFAILVGLSPIYRVIQFFTETLRQIAQIFPYYISGPLVIGIGFLLVWWGQKQTFGSITEVLMPDEKDDLVDRLLVRRRLNRGPKIVAIGGGTGLSTLLRGLKEYSAHITAVVTVADDGGSSGRLRREIGGLPPGDLRNCMAALADQEKLITELFQYRFEAGDGLAGHSFGNLFLTAMNEITDSWEQAIAASSQVLAVRGEVLPATLSDVCLWATLEDGRHIEGESQITAARGKIIKIGCTPANPPALPQVLKAICEADYIILGPGSLYTSIAPNLLVPEIVTAIAHRYVPRIYICNIMSQPGETEGYTVSDHVRALDAVCGQRIIDAVLVQNKPPSPLAQERYAQEQSHPIDMDREALLQLGCRVLLANVMDEDPDTKLVRHSSQRLARVLLRWYSRVHNLKANAARKSRAKTNQRLHLPHPRI